MSGHTLGPWDFFQTRNGSVYVGPSHNCTVATLLIPPVGEMEANARLIAAAPVQHAEMVRFLPVLERAEADPELWTRLTEGTGIATANAYRAAIAAATGDSHE